jgi:hypothetical protein
MTFHASLMQLKGKFVATCLEIEAYGEGRTREQAVDALRQALEEREAPQAVAPPRNVAPPGVEVVVVDDETDPGHP